MVKTKKANNIISENSCFDLQFRRDVKHKRLNKPIYYSWKAQFVITGKYKDEDAVRDVQALLNCGRLHFMGKNKIRYSVQSISDLYLKIVPSLKKNNLFSSLEKKKNDFELWAQAVEILFKNKGKEIKKWKKEDFSEMIKIQKEMQKYKIKKVRGEKWLSIAETIFS